MDEMTMRKITAEALSDETRLPVYIGIKDALVLVTALELAADYPKLSVPTQGFIARIARVFRRAITDRHPDCQRGAKIKVLEKAMRDERLLSVTITIAQAWMLVSAVQLTARHPDLESGLAQRIIELGQQFQGSIAELHPDWQELLEMGWSPEFDL